MVKTARQARSKRVSAKTRAGSTRQRLKPQSSNSYWETTRSPLASLMLVAPLLIAYEVGCLWFGQSEGPSVRTGADFWIRQAIANLGGTDHRLLPCAVIAILVGWQAVHGRGWRVSPSIVSLMIIESLVLAVALVGLSRLVDLTSVYLETPTTHMLAVNNQANAQFVPAFLGFLGAGIYEEVLFRLILVPGIFYGLRLIRIPHVLASALAVTSSGLLFSLAHHAGIPGEPFTWFAFVFRWFAGVAFAWIFVIRGFGIAVGTHTAYDILVGWFGWHF